MSDFFKWLTATGLTPFAAVGWICVGVVAWMNLRWRVKTLEINHEAMSKRHDKMESVIEKQVEITRDVELNSRELKTIAAVTERRLTLVEDRVK